MENVGSCHLLQALKLKLSVLISAFMHERCPVYLPDLFELCTCDAARNERPFILAGQSTTEQIHMSDI